MTAPFSLFGLGRPVSADETSQATALVDSLNVARRMGNADAVWRTAMTADGAVMRASIINGVTKVVVSPAPQNTPAKSSAVQGVPVFFSGRVIDTYPRKGAPMRIAISLTTKKRLVSYSKKAPPLPDILPRHSFVIPVGEQPPSGKFVRTQYTGLFPSMYSGAMKSVAQFVLGYGKQTPTLDSYDKVIEQPVFVRFPPDVYAAMAKQAPRPLGCKGVVPADGVFGYANTFRRSEGIFFGKDKKPWLIRVADKVEVMPLPLLPLTTTRAFSDYMSEVGDDEALAVIDKFGGFPSGETFPTKRDYRLWVSAGVIIKLCDAQEFLAQASFSGAELGWSFAETTNEAVNTCWTYGPDEMQVGSFYKLSAKLGAITPTPRGNPPTTAQERLDNAARSRYVHEVILAGKEAKWSSLSVAALSFKLTRSPNSVVDARVKGVKNYAIELAYWETKELPPIAVCSGVMRRVSSGRMHSSLKLEYQPQLKLPTSLGCASHDFNPGGARDRWFSEAALRFDTVVFAYFSGDSLKTVRFTNDPRLGPRAHEDDFDECMLVGSWTSVDGSSSTRVQGQFYTSDFDSREESAESVTTVKITGKYLGVTGKYFSLTIPYTTGGITRDHWFLRTTDSNTTSTVTIANAVCVPMMNRDMVVYPSTKHIAGKTTNWGQAVFSINDAHHYTGWTYSFIAHYLGGTGPQEGVKDASPSYVLSYDGVDDGPCSGYVNKGPFCEVGEDVSAQRVSGWNAKGKVPPAPMTAAPPRATSVANIGSGSIRLDYCGKQPALNVSPDPAYFWGSPTLSGDFFYCEATSNCFGDSEFFRFTRPGSPEGSVSLGFSKYAAPEGPSNFIGVVNE